MGNKIICTTYQKAKDSVLPDPQNVSEPEPRGKSKKDNSQENNLTKNSDNCPSKRGIPRTRSALKQNQKRKNWTLLVKRYRERKNKSQYARKSKLKEEQDENKRNAQEIEKPTSTNDALLEQNSTLTLEKESIQRQPTLKIQIKKGLQKKNEELTDKLECVTRQIEDLTKRIERKQEDMENERKCHLEKIEELGVKIVKLETESEVKTRKIEELEKDIATLQNETKDKETDMKERFDIELENSHAQHKEDCTRHAKQHSDDMKQMQAQFDDLCNILRFDQKVGQDSVNAVMQRLTQVTDNTTSALNATYWTFQSTSQQPKSGPSVREILDTCDADDI